MKFLQYAVERCSHVSVYFMCVVYARYIGIYRMRGEPSSHPPFCVIAWHNTLNLQSDGTRR